MPTRIRRRRVLVAALGGAAFAALAITVASSHATQIDVRELPTSTPAHPASASLAPGNSYRASRVNPTPTVTPRVHGWRGTQFETHRHGKGAYQSVGLLWRDFSDRGILIVSGPALTRSPAATIAEPRERAANWT